MIQQYSGGNLFLLDRHRYKIRLGIAGTVVALHLIPDVVITRIGSSGNRRGVGAILS